MLVPWCQSLELQEVIIAARFFSHRVQLEALQKNYLCVSLNYYCATSRVQFLEAVTQWHGLKYLHIVSSFARPYIFLRID